MAQPYQGLRVYTARLLVSERLVRWHQSHSRLVQSIPTSVSSSIKLMAAGSSGNTYVFPIQVWHGFQGYQKLTVVCVGTIASHRHLWLRINRAELQLTLEYPYPASSVVRNSKVFVLENTTKYWFPTSTVSSGDITRLNVGPCTHLKTCRCEEFHGCKIPLTILWKNEFLYHLSIPHSPVHSLKKFSQVLGTSATKSSRSRS